MVDEGATASVVAGVVVVSVPVLSVDFSSLPLQEVKNNTTVKNDTGRNLDTIIVVSFTCLKKMAGGKQQKK